MLVAAADRAGLAGHQCRAQSLDILAARQTLALEHGKGDRERLLGRISIDADLFAQWYQAVQFGLLFGGGVQQFASAGFERTLLRPELAQCLGFALGLAPVVELSMQSGQLFGQPDVAVALALQVVQRLAGHILLGFGGLGLRFQRGELALALLQACRQLDGLLQTRTVTVPCRTEWLQGCTRFEWLCQRRELFGGALLLLLELFERCLAGAGRGIGLDAFFADRGEVGVQMLQAFFFTARLDEPRLGVLARLFGRTQLLAGGAALALQLGQALLHGLFLMLQARQAVGGLVQQRAEILQAQETMALRRQLLEQVEDAPGLGEVFALVFGILQLLACRFALVFQALQFAEPLPLRFQRLELLLQRFQFVELSLMFALQFVTLLRLQWLQAAGLLLQTGEAFLRLLGGLEGGLAEAAVEAGIGELFQEGAALVVVGLEEGGKFALRQQHGAGELGQGQPKAGFEQFLEFAFLAAGQERAAVEIRKALAAGLQAAVDLLAGALDLPACAVAVTVDADEIDLGVAAAAAAAQQVALVATADLGIYLGHLVQRRNAVEPRRAAEQRQAQGVENGALAGTGGPGDGEQPGAGQGFGGEIDDLLTGQRRQVLQADGEDFHRSSSV